MMPRCRSVSRCSETIRDHQWFSETFQKTLSYDLRVVVGVDRKRVAIQWVRRLTGTLVELNSTRLRHTVGHLVTVLAIGLRRLRSLLQRTTIMISIRKLHSLFFVLIVTVAIVVVTRITGRVQFGAFEQIAGRFDADERVIWAKREMRLEKLTIRMGCNQR